MTVLFVMVNVEKLVGELYKVQERIGVVNDSEDMVPSDSLLEERVEIEGAIHSALVDG